MLRIARGSYRTTRRKPLFLRLCRSCLKERGRVKALVTSDLGCLRPRRTRRDRHRGQGSGGARPGSGRRALRSAPGSTNNVGGGDSSGAGPQKSAWVGVRSSGPGVPAGGRPGWAAGHPYAAAGGGMMGFAVSTGRRGQSHGATTPGVGGHDLPRPAPTREKPKAVFMPPSADVPGRVRDRHVARRRRAPVDAWRLRPSRCCGLGGRRPVLVAPRPRWFWRWF